MTTSATDELQRLNQEFQRLIHRRGDLSTMRDDKQAELDAIDREHTATVGAIQATRARIATLSEQARQSPMVPKLVPEVVDLPAAKK